jgi:predicted DCC family thiol-disulfide oxidoreductase YuxK
VHGNAKLGGTSQKKGQVPRWSSMLEDERPGGRLTVYYDGDCPLCRSYTRMMRLRETIGRVDLVDARQAPDAVSRFSSLGLKIDEGFVVDANGRLYHGADALHALALLTSPVGVFNRINPIIFSRPRLAAFLYPLLVRGRAWLLWLLGRKPILS